MRLVTDPPCPWRLPEMFVSTPWMLVAPSTSTDGWNFLQNLAFCHVTMSPAFKGLSLARFSGLNPGDIAMVTNGMWGCGDVGMGLPSSSLQATHKGSRGLCSNTRLLISLCCFYIHCCPSVLYKSRSATCLCTID